MRKCGSAHASRASFWVVAHNALTDHYVCGPERRSLSSAVADVQFMCQWVGPRDFARLTKDDSVTFYIERWPQDENDDEDFVGSWGMGGIRSS
jgi:hypothetical protein